MKNNINSQLSNVSENLGVLLDKALCEEVFRWQLITEPNEILKQYEISDENDIKIVQNMIKQLKVFICNRAQTLSEGINICSYKEANPNLTYSEAMNYRKTHNL